MQLPAAGTVSIKILRISALMLVALASVAQADNPQTGRSAIAPVDPAAAASVSQFPMPASISDGNAVNGNADRISGDRSSIVKELSETFESPTGMPSMAWLALLAPIALAAYYLRRRRRSDRLQSAYRWQTPQPGKRRFEDLAPAGALPPGTEPKTILLVVENLPVPYDRRVWQEALALHSAGFQVSVVSPATKRHPKLSEVLEGIHVYRYPMMIEGQGKLGLIFEYLWSFCCILLWSIFVSFRRGFKAIMIANPPEIFFPIIWMWRFLGKKTVFDHHDLTPELFATKFKVDRSIILSFFYFAERRMLRAVHKVVSTNESYKAIDMRRGRRVSDDVIVIRNAPDPRRFSVRSLEPELRKSAKYLLGFLGEIGEQDGVDILLRAIKSISETLGPNAIHCVLMGGGPYYDKIVVYAEKLGISDSITFTGRADNDTICRVLSSVDLAVDPCPHSPHADLSTATKIMEYMFFSLPIVAFDLLETRRSGADTVCYARIGEEDDFVRQIIDLLGDEAKRKELGQAARIRLDTALSWHVSARRLVTLMTSLIGAPVPREQEEIANTSMPFQGQRIAIDAHTTQVLAVDDAATPDALTVERTLGDGDDHRKGFLPTPT